MGITKRLALTLASGMEVRLFDVHVGSPQGRRILAINHRARVAAEWRGGVPLATLFLDGEAGVDLGPFDPRAMKYMEHLSKH